MSLLCGRGVRVYVGKFVFVWPHSQASCCAAVTSFPGSPPAQRQQTVRRGEPGTLSHVMHDTSTSQLK